jgi:two-component system phosphate regulon response regulator PhoB
MTAEPLQAADVPQSPVSPPRTRRALVIDDDALSRCMLRDALAERGFEVITASDGVTGLQVLCDELLRLDVLITDLFMPGLDGGSLVRQIRGPGGETELAVLLVTAAAPAELAALPPTGADVVLRKDIGPEEIARIADAVVARRRAGRTA